MRVSVHGLEVANGLDSRADPCGVEVCAPLSGRLRATPGPRSGGDDPDLAAIAIGTSLGGRPVAGSVGSACEVVALVELWVWRKRPARSVCDSSCLYAPCACQA